MSLNNQLIITGFHRSGTSLIARMISGSGLFLGDKLLGSRPSNPYGHFEDKEVLKIHNRILKDSGHDWKVDRCFIPTVNPDRWKQISAFIQNRHLNHKDWGFKDPRACLFLPIWKYCIPDLKVVAIFRHYDACKQSLLKRHADDLAAGRGSKIQHQKFWDDPDLAYKIWLVYNQGLINFKASNPEDILLVAFEDVVQGLNLIEKINTELDLNLSNNSAKVIDKTIISDSKNSDRPKDKRMIQELEEILLTLNKLSTSLEP